MRFSTKLTKKSKKWRGALIYLALFGVAPMAFGAETETRYVSDYSGLKAAIAEFNENTGANYKIVLTNNVALAGNLPAITGNVELEGVPSGSLTIEGSGHSISGQDQYRGLYVDSAKAGGTITVSNVLFTDCLAQGGAGGAGASGAGGGMGAGAAIYALSGDVVLSDVTTTNNVANGGMGGGVLYGANSYAGGGGLGGNGGSGVISETGAANGGGIFVNGAGSSADRSAGDGGVTSDDAPESFGHNEGGTSTPVGGHSLSGGGGGGSMAIGGNGGFGGGAGAGAMRGGVGGFGGGGAGGADAKTAGLGGFGAGSGGYQEPVTSKYFDDTPGGGTGGGGAALGAAIFVGENANLTVAVSDDRASSINGNSVNAGLGGGGSAENGEAIGSGVFLLNDLSIQVAKGGTYTISDSIGGYAGSNKVVVGANGKYENTSGIVKSGEGALVLNAGASSYTGDTIVKDGSLVANAEGALSSYSALNVERGNVELNANQSVKTLNGGVDGKVDIKSNALTISGGEDGVYAGKIDGTGVLVKNGKDSLSLAGDSRPATFTTILNGGTINVMNDGAFGSGTIRYTRSNANDQTSSLNFVGERNLANDIVLDGNTNSLILSGDSATLSGNITARPGSNSEIVVRMNEGASFNLTNTGVVTDENGTYYAGTGNNAANYVFESGNMVVAVDSFEKDGVRYWYNGLGDATIKNSGDNVLAFSLKTDDPSAGMRFSNNMELNSGFLTVQPVNLAGETTTVADVVYDGNTSGNGGLRIDVNDGSTFHVLGNLNHGYTDVATGTLDLSQAKGSQVFVGGLSSDGAGAVNLGNKEMIVGFDASDVVFSGKIVGDGDGATIYKRGTGAWTMDLTNNSKVDSVQVQDGVFSLGSNHFGDGMYPSNDFGIVLGPNGTFKHETKDGATLALNNFDASQGGAIVIGENDELTLTGANKSTELAANLNGSGWLYLDNVSEDGKVKPWILSGNNSNWNGTIAAYDPYAQLTFTNGNSGSMNSNVNLGSFGTLNVLDSTGLNSLDFDNNATINIASGKTFALNDLTSNVMWLDDSVLTIDGGGSVALNKGAASSYYGATLIKGGSSLVLNGDNTVVPKYGAQRHETTLTDGGSLVMDYSKSSYDGVADSYWGSPIRVDGLGGVTVYNNALNGAVNMNEKIAFVGTDKNELTFNTTNSTVYLRSVIDGYGALVKTGNGTLILDGVGGFSDANISNGVVQLGTSPSNYGDQLAYSNVVLNGGALTGWTNDLGSVALNSGTLKLSNVGTVNLNGSGNAFSMNGGTLNIDVIDSNTYTNFVAKDPNATATMESGTIYVNTAEYGTELQKGDTLSVVRVGEGKMYADPSAFTIYDDYVGKRFVVDSNALSQGKFNLVLRASAFSDFARSANERSVARYLDDWRDGKDWDPTYNNFFSQLENAVERNPGVLNHLTGEMRFTAMNAQVQSRNLIRQNLTRNVLPSTTYSSCCGDGMTSCCSAVRGQSWDYSGREPGAGFSGWASAFGAGGDASAHYGTSGYDYSLLGGMFGVELGSTVSNQFGFYYSYSNMDVDSGSALGDVSVGDNVFGLYLRANDAWGYTLATGSIGVSNYDYNRAIALGNYPTQWYEGSTDGWSGSAYLEHGFTLHMPMSDLQPYGGVQYTHLQADAFRESGTFSAFALDTTDTEYDSLQGVIGIRWLKSMVVGQHMFDFNAYTNWTHEFLDQNAEGQVSIVAGPDRTFRIIGNGAGRDWIYAGLGGTWMLSDNFDVFGGSDVQVNDYTTYVNGNFGFKLKW